jgi:hypothetical protein
MYLLFRLLISPIQLCSPSVILTPRHFGFHRNLQDGEEGSVIGS